MATGHHLEIRESSTGSCLGNTTRGPHPRYQLISGNWKKKLPEKSLGSVLWFFLILEIKIRLFLKADSNLQINTSVKQRSIYVGRSIFSLLRFHHVFQTKGGLLHELFHMFGVMHTQMNLIEMNTSKFINRTSYHITDQNIRYSCFYLFLMSM